MAQNNGLIVKFVKHYHVNDENCEDKYYESEIVINGKCFINLGACDVDQDPADYFEGFVDGLKYLDKFNKKRLDVLQIEYEHKNDYNKF